MLDMPTTFKICDLMLKQIILTLLKRNPMLTKAQLKKTILNLPDSFTIDELIDQLIFTEKVEAGIVQSLEGKVISNDDVKRIIEKWSA